MSALINIWRLLDRRQRWHAVALQLLTLLVALSTVGGVAAVLPFFAVLSDPGAIGRNRILASLYEWFSFSTEREFAFALGLVFVAAILLSNLVNLLGSLAMERFAFRVGDTFRIALFDEYLNRSYRFHVGTHSAVLVRNVVHEAARVASGMLHSALTLIAHALVIAGVAVSVLIVDPLTAVASVGLLGGSYLAMYAVSRNRLRRNGATESRFAMERTTLLQEGFSAIKEVILLQGQQALVDRFTRACHAISKTLLSTHLIALYPRHIVECLTTLGLVAIALLLAMRPGGSTAWLAQLSFLALAAYRILPAVQQAYSAVVKLRANRSALDNIETDLRAARGRASRPEAGRLHCWTGGCVQHLRLRGVTFRYSSQGPAAIRRIDLDLYAGRMVGFMGANGSGKTTLADIIAGLLTPDSGSIEIDGIPLDERNRVAWRAHLAYVPQHVFLMDASIAENVTLGVSPGSVDPARVERAIRMARLEECIASLPRGIDEPIRERGERLSGGQRQRIGIARALYRDAGVLILDEPTSSLDPASEQDIMQGLHALRAGRIVIVISHRPETLRHCDVVFELKDGMLRDEAKRCLLATSSWNR